MAALAADVLGAADAPAVDAAAPVVSVAWLSAVLVKHSLRTPSAARQQRGLSPK